MRASRCFRRVGSLLLLLILSGCSFGPRIVKVSGIVKRGGKPLPNVEVAFIPEQGRVCKGVSDDTGTFEVDNVRDHKQQVQKGLLQGTYRVVVKFVPRTPQQEMKGFARPPDAEEILKKYGNEATTPLQVEVKEDGQVISIDLD